MRVTLPNNWDPRHYQLPLWRYLEGGGKRAVAVWHRRAGKDDVCLHWTAVSAMKRPGTYWHLLPEAAQARKAIWDAVNPHTGKRRVDEAFPREIRRKTRENEMFIELITGATWQVVGSDNYNSLVGSPPVGVVFSEWALADPAAWAYLRPILLENGGWALFILTPRGRNHGATFYEAAKTNSDWFADRLTVEDTGIFGTAALEQERRELIQQYGEQEGEQQFRQEYYCDFQAAVLGSYYGKEMADAEKAGRIGRVPYEPRKEVETWWDLGVGDSTSIWFAQRVNAEVRLIDYYEMTGEGLGHYVKVLKEKPYVYGRHIAPHDIEVREFTGDGKTRREIAAGLGIKFEVAPNLPVDDGINAVRSLLPRCWFDAEKCSRGIDALRQYRKDYDEKLKTFRSKPRHDWASHSADAFRYGAVVDEPSGDWSKPVKYRPVTSVV